MNDLDDEERASAVMDKVSVIVPAYNVEDYVERAILSLTRQTHTELEIILIDDGSTDRTGQICDRLAEAEPRLIVIHQANSGASAARNAGLDLASGDWVTFADADDIVPYNAIAQLVRTALQFSADVVSGAYTTNLSHVDADLRQESVMTMSGRAAQVALLYQRVIANGPYAKLYSRRRIADVRFPVGIPVAEDLSFNFDALGRLNVVAVTSSVVYQYILRPGGAIGSMDGPERALAQTVTRRILSQARADGELKLVAAATCRDFMEAVFVGTRVGDVAQRRQCSAILREHRNAVVNDTSAPSKYRAIAALAHLTPSIAITFMRLYAEVKARMAGDER